MSGLELIFGLPVFFAVAWLFWLVRGPRSGLLLSLIVCAATIGIGYWSILQSRASTAGIGVLFLPAAGALSGLLAVTFARLRQNPRLPIRIAAWLCLAAGLASPVSSVVGTFRMRAMYRDADRRSEANRQTIAETREKIELLMLESPGRETAVLDAEIDRHRDDSLFMTAALETAFVSEERLDQLAADNHLLMLIARNRRTRSDTLEKIFRKKMDDPKKYFWIGRSEFQAMAGHKNTPAAILQMIADDPKRFEGTYDYQFATNPSTPRGVLARIADTANVHMLQALMGNAALDCELVRTIAARLGPDDRNEVHSTDEAIAERERRLCAAK